jgi:tRNA (adenine37-N6)-methyltransferase
MDIFSIEPVGQVEGGRREAVDDDWGRSRALIRLDGARFGAEALTGLDSFSHAEIIFLFDRVAPDRIETSARHPRGRTDWPRVGIFAQRGKDRPNRLGVSICRIVAVDGLALEVEGLDAIDGTPVIDIKPVLSGFVPRGEVREPDWAKAIMKDYW